jgi:hypothetical protein
MEVPLGANDFALIFVTTLRVGLLLMQSTDTLLTMKTSQVWGFESRLSGCYERFGFPLPISIIQASLLALRIRLLSLLWLNLKAERL